MTIYEPADFLNVANAIRAAVIAKAPLHTIVRSDPEHYARAFEAAAKLPGDDRAIKLLHLFQQVLMPSILPLTP